MRNILKKDPRLHSSPEDKKLLSLPIVIRVNKFTEESAKEFANLMSEAHNTGQPVIPVLIDSYGGYVYSLLSMLAEIENSRLPVATISIGKSMSCGSILLAAGTSGYRYMDSNSTVMVHEVSSGAFGKIEDMKISVNETERLNKLILRKMALTCGHRDKDYFLKLISNKKHADWFMTAHEAKKHKIIDHIGMPEFETTVSVNIKFIGR